MAPKNALTSYPEALACALRKALVRTGQKLDGALRGLPLGIWLKSIKYWYRGDIDNWI